MVSHACKAIPGGAAEFRCQFPAGTVLAPGIPLPEGSEKLHATPCYRTIIWDGEVIFGCRMRILHCRQGRFAAPALQQFVREEKLPGSHVQSDDELLDYARRNGSTCYHASCTCMMGSYPMSVVDSELRVHGIDGLRVIDASVMPAVTSTNTNAPTIMIAEKG